MNLVGIAGNDHTFCESTFWWTIGLPGIANTPIAIDRSIDESQLVDRSWFCIELTRYLKRTFFNKYFRKYIKMKIVAFYDILYLWLYYRPVDCELSRNFIVFFFFEILYNPNITRQYKSYRNKLTHLKEISKQNYYKQAFEKCHHDIKKTWKLVN